MKSKKIKKEYDLILIMGYFRSALPYLSIVKNLNHKKIGLVVYYGTEFYTKKVDQYSQEFISLLIKEGAEICLPKHILYTDLLLIQQHTYEEKFLSKISSIVKYKKAIALIGYRMGFRKNDLFLKYFKVNTCVINDINIYNLLINKRDCKNIYSKYKILEVGLPYHKYPPFETPKIDWLIASPTTFSFDTEIEKNKYLRNIIKVINQIDSSKIIAYKQHNADQKDYLKRYFLIVRYIPFPEKFAKIIEKILPYSPFFFREKLYTLLSAIYQKIILNRVICLSKLSEFSFLSVEAFIPNLNNGVIGGNSNTIWGTRFYNKKYLNCIEPLKIKQNDFKSKQTIGINLTYFGVPFCQNNINYEIKKDFKIFSDYEINIVDLIFKYLEK